MTSISLSVIGAAAFAACIVAWAMAFRRATHGRGLLPASPRDAVPWGLSEILLTALILLFVQGIFQAATRLAFQVDLQAATESLPDEVQLMGVLSAAIGTLVTLVLSILAIRLASGARWEDLGVEPRYWFRDLKLGLGCFVLIAPPVYLIQFLLVQWYPSAHPLVAILKRGTNWWALAICSFSAVIVAPVAEEYLFRVLLQGWFERLAKVEGGLRRRASEENGTPGPSLNSSEHDLSNPYTPPSIDEMAIVNADKKSEAEADVPLKAWPILASAAFFGAMHWSHGPDPIPLCVLALALGYVYQRTHRILPCIVVHLLLNATSMALLIWELAGHR